MLEMKNGGRKAPKKKSLLPERQKNTFNSGDYFMQQEQEKAKNEAKKTEEED